MSAFSQVKPTFRSLQSSNNIKQHKSMSFRWLPQSCKRYPGSSNQWQTTAAMASIISPLSGYYIIHAHTRNITNAFNCEAISGECLRILYFDSINVCDYLFRTNDESRQRVWVSQWVLQFVAQFAVIVLGCQLAGCLSVCLAGNEWICSECSEYIAAGQLNIHFLRIARKIARINC